MAVSYAQAQTQSRRAVLASSENEIPQFTIQIDAFETLTEAVEFGYELPFDENTLGLAKFRQGAAVRYILALGTFYTYGEANGVLREMCPSAALDNCRVRYLGDLESIEADGAEDIATPAIAVAPAAEEILDVPPLVIAPETPSAEVFEEDLSPPTDVNANSNSLDAMLAEDEALLIEAPAVAAPPRAYDGELVYTVQVAAMYSKVDAQRIVDRMPGHMGQGEVLPLIGGRGNLVHSVTIGRFAYKDKAQVFADDVCDAVGLSGCWVKPLAMVERELAQAASEPVAPIETAPSVDTWEAEVIAPVPEPELPEPAPIVVQDSAFEPVTPAPKRNQLVIDQAEPEGERLIYTVQVAAMYDENDANNVASRISNEHGAIEVVPIRSVNGDVVYSVTVGRFAYKDVGQEVADSVCNQLNLSGCWVKPFSLIEKARVEEW